MPVVSDAGRVDRGAEASKQASSSSSSSSSSGRRRQTLGRSGRRRRSRVRFSDVSIRVYDSAAFGVSSSSAHSSPSSGSECGNNDDGENDNRHHAATTNTATTATTTVIHAFDDAPPLPINLFENYVRRGVGIRTKTRTKLPRDFEERYRRHLERMKDRHQREGADDDDDDDDDTTELYPFQQQLQQEKKLRIKRRSSLSSYDDEIMGRFSLYDGPTSSSASGRHRTSQRRSNSCSY